MEHHKRAIGKTLSWRIIASLTTMAIVFVFTGKLNLTIEVGVVEVISKLLFFYLHELLWGKISWGTPKHPLSDLIVKSEISPKDKEIIAEKLKELGYL